MNRNGTRVGPRWAREDWPVELTDGTRYRASGLRALFAAEFEAQVRVVCAGRLMTPEVWHELQRAAWMDTFGLATRQVVREEN